jgi:hypothetical protein
MIISLIIPSIRLLPTRSGQMEPAPNVSRQFPSGPVQSDGEHLSRNRKVVGSTPTSGSENPQVSGLTGEVSVTRRSVWLDSVGSDLIVGMIIERSSPTRWSGAYSQLGSRRNRPAGAAARASRSGRVEEAVSRLLEQVKGPVHGVRRALVVWGGRDLGVGAQRHNGDGGAGEQHGLDPGVRVVSQ